ncbi:MAG: MFS transporter [Albidovulum sp.]
MKSGLAVLVAAYVLSQFYRVFLAVLTPILGREIGTTPADLATSSGLWFAAFALMQFPVGAALDRVGPRLTATILLGFGGGGGALVFATAQSPASLHLAMVLIGIGCSPVLMASYFIFARIYSARIFGTLAGVMVGLGSLGNIAGAAPLAHVVESYGWRETLVGLAVVTIAVALAIAVVLRDPPPIDKKPGQHGSMRELLAIRALWPILALMLVAYAPAAVVRGLWAGPYLHGVYGADASGIGRATLVMGLAMVLGNFALGSIDRALGSRKWGVVAGVSLSALCLGALIVMPAPGFWASTALLAGLGFFGATYPAIMSHGRSFLPPHLIGRGVSFINLFSIGGAGLMQFGSRPVYQALSTSGDAAHTFSLMFAFFLLPLLMGLAVYLFSHDNRV